MRLIDADALMDDIAVLLERNHKLIDEWLANCIDDVIEQAPTVDVVDDLVKAFCEDGTWLESQGVYTLTLVEAKQRAVDIIESVMAKTEPQQVTSKLANVENPTVSASESTMSQPNGKLKTDTERNE